MSKNSLRWIRPTFVYGDGLVILSWSYKKEHRDISLCFGWYREIKNTNKTQSVHNGIQIFRTSQRKEYWLKNRLSGRKGHVFRIIGEVRKLKGKIRIALYIYMLSVYLRFCIQNNHLHSFVQQPGGICNIYCCFLRLKTQIK